MKKMVIVVAVMATMLTGCTDECPPAVLDYHGGVENIITEQIMTEHIETERIETERIEG